MLSVFHGPGALAGAVEGYDDVPGTQSQPVGPESLIQSEEALIPPRLHHPVQGSFVHRASGQNALVHHAGPDHIHGVGGQRTCQPASETRTVVRKVKQTALNQNAQKSLSRVKDSGLHEMCQDCVSHQARAEQVLLCDVIDRKFHPHNDGCSLCCGNDALRGRKMRNPSLTAYNTRNASNYFASLRRETNFNRRNTAPLWLQLTTAPGRFMKSEIRKINQSSSYSPQPPGPLRLVDVDEVGHHAALEQTALSLHPDLEQHEDT